MGRWGFACRVGDVHAGAHLLLHPPQRSRQQIDLSPLRGDGGVELFNGLILKRNARLQRIEPGGQIGHGLLPQHAYDGSPLSHGAPNAKCLMHRFLLNVNAFVPP